MCAIYVPYEAESLIKMAQGSILTATCCKEIKASETAIEVQAMQGERRKKDKLLRCTGMHCKEDWIELLGGCSHKQLPVQCEVLQYFNGKQQKRCITRCDAVQRVVSWIGGLHLQTIPEMTLSTWQGGEYESGSLKRRKAGWKCGHGRIKRGSSARPCKSVKHLQWRGHFKTNIGHASPLMEEYGQHRFEWKEGFIWEEQQKGLSSISTSSRGIMFLCEELSLAEHFLLDARFSQMERSLHEDA